MARYAAFLRAINVGGHLVKSTELCEVLTATGYQDVAAFRASGNVVLSAADSDGPDQITARIEAALADAFGYAVPVYLRTAAQVRAITKHRPFPAPAVEASDGKLQVALLAAAPEVAVRTAVLALATDQDRLVFRGTELYWLPSGRLTDSGLDLRALEKKVGSWTMRTKGTIDQIAARFFGA